MAHMVTRQGAARVTGCQIFKMEIPLKRLRRHKSRGSHKVGSGTSSDAPKSGCPTNAVYIPDNVDP